MDPVTLDRLTPPPARRFIYLDTETTGLDPELHDMIEFTLIDEEGRSISDVVPHDLSTADNEALIINGYNDRGLFEHADKPRDPVTDAALHAWLDDATVVAANAPFDCAFLGKYLGVAYPARPWHYRTLEIESYGAGVMGLGYVPAFDHLVALVEHRTGVPITPPGHTSYTDAHAVRAVHNLLRTHRGQCAA